MRTKGCPTTLFCAGCGIPLSDAYTRGCAVCRDRQTSRVRAGILFSPTGYAGELIDNRTGRLVAGTL